jgi:hypothetical protein
MAGPEVMNPVNALPLLLAIVAGQPTPAPIDTAAAARRVNRKDYEYLAKAVDSRREVLFKLELDVMAKLTDLEQALTELRRNYEQTSPAQRLQIEWDADQQTKAEADLRVLIQRARSALSADNPDYSKTPTTAGFTTPNPRYHDPKAILRVGERVTIKGKVYIFEKQESDGRWRATRTLPTPELIASFATEVVLWADHSRRSLRQSSPRREWPLIMESLQEVPERVHAVLARFHDPLPARPHTAEEGVKLAFSLDALIEDWSGKGEGRAAKLLGDLEEYQQALCPIIASFSSPAPAKSRLR